MPDRSQIARLENLEGRAGLAAKTHIVWISDGDDPDPTATINRWIAEGRAKADDKFYTVAWREPTGEPETPMGPDLDPFTAAPKPAPPPDPPAWSPGGSPLVEVPVTPLPDNDWGGSTWFWGRDIQP